MTHTLGKAGTRYNLWEYSDLRIREKDFEVAIINMLKEVKVTTVKEKLSHVSKLSQLVNDGP